MYPINNTWLDLETLAKADSVEGIDTLNFKTMSKYANRFNVVNLLGEVPKEAVYKGRPFKIIDATHMGYKIPPATKFVEFEVSKEEDKLDDVPGNDFLVSVADGIVHVQRFEGKQGYRVSRLDEWGHVKFRQNFQHTMYTKVKGQDEEFKTPYLFYFTHTDRFMVFTSLSTRSIHKTIVMDLKDGKMLPIESTVCGVVRADNELAFAGYLMRDEAGNRMTVNMAGNSWGLGDKNIMKLVAETIVSDSLLIMARYHQGAPGIGLSAFNAKTGKPVWTAEVKQSAAAVQGINLSMYKNKLLMEIVQGGDHVLEAFDLANGKRLYSTL